MASSPEDLQQCPGERPTWWAKVWSMRRLTVFSALLLTNFTVTATSGKVQTQSSYTLVVQ